MRSRPPPFLRSGSPFRNVQKRRRLTSATRDTKLGQGDPRGEERVETVLDILVDAASRIFEEERAAGGAPDERGGSAGDDDESGSLHQG